jgi:hypothetical protein
MVCPSHTVALLVTTYRRNEALTRLVAELAGRVARHAGPNRYFVCVADSDRANRVELPPGVSVIVNPGEGFDDNLLAAFRFLAGNCDFVFAIADDDLPEPGADLLNRLDAVLADDPPDVVLFNHRLQRRAEPDEPGRRFYSADELPNLLVDPVPVLTRRLPSYAGIFYRAAFVESIRDELMRLRGSLHLYAAPIFIAADRGRFRFSDHAVVRFDDSPKADGAWESTFKVHQGLLRFLGGMQALLSPGAHAHLVHGMYHVFFRPQRKYLWGAELSGAPDFGSLESFQAHLQAYRGGPPAAGVAA